MSRLLRHYSSGQVYFITLVTYKRAPVLIIHFEAFWKAVQRTKARVKFDLIAWVVLQDHFHMIIDPLDHNPSDILNRIKRSFAHQLRVHHCKRPGAIWQPRFWDHIIRNQIDLNNHINYIHYNPVKHEILTNPFNWGYSSLGDYFNNGYYAPDWGVSEKLQFEGDYGE